MICFVPLCPGLSRATLVIVDNVKEVAFIWPGTSFVRPYNVILVRPSIGLRKL